jgi:hypothetical protein
MATVLAKLQGSENYQYFGHLAPVSLVHQCPLESLILDTSPQTQPQTINGWLSIWTTIPQDQLLVGCFLKHSSTRCYLKAPPMLACLTILRNRQLLTTRKMQCHSQQRHLRFPPAMAQRHSQKRVSPCCRSCCRLRRPALTLLLEPACTRSLPLQIRHPLLGC